MKKKKVIIAVFLMCLTFSLQAKAQIQTNPNDSDVNGKTFANETSGAIKYSNGSSGGVSEHNIKNATFNNNSTSYGGAINSGVKLGITGGSFTGNKATANVGGAIYAGQELTINGTSFSNNEAKQNGGAIYKGSTGNLNITNAKFNGNQTTGEGSSGSNDQGGAIWSSSESSITNTVFDNNKAKQSGGAIFQSDKELTLKGGSFTGNEAAYYGGAIYVYQEDKNGSSKNGSLNVDGTKFIDNKTTTSNKTGNGGAIHLHEKANGTITNAEFTGNSAGNAGAIFAGTGELNITNTAFNNNTANGNRTVDNGGYGNAGAIYAKGKTTIKGSTFNGNTANNWGGALFQEKGDSDDAKLMIENSSFNNNTAAAAGAIVTNAETTITNSNFKSNTATNGFGGAIYNNSEKELSVENTNFASNSALRGGAIFGTKNTTTNVTGGTFSGNSVTGRVSGGNPVYGQGGAIFTDRESSGLTVEGATFDGNTAENEGGAIWSGNTINVDNAVFKNNRTTGTAFGNGNEGKPDYQKDAEGGGAIFLGSNVENAIIENSQFIGNSSATVGGAIATRSNANSEEKPTFEIHNSTFSGNSAAKNGGASLLMLKQLSRIQAL